MLQLACYMGKGCEVRLYGCGIAVSTALRVNVGMSMMAGMVLELLIGAQIDRKR